MSRLAVDLDMPVALLDDAEDHGQSQPGPLADPFRREERLEDAGFHFRRHAAAGVGHRQQDVAARLDFGVHTGVFLRPVRRCGFPRSACRPWAWRRGR